MRRDIFKFLSGFAAAASFGHIAAAVATARGMMATPIWRGREWGIGKMLIEAVVYGAVGAGLGYLGWRPESRQLMQAEPVLMRPSGVSDHPHAASA